MRGTLVYDNSLLPINATKVKGVKSDPIYLWLIYLKHVTRALVINL